MNRTLVPLVLLAACKPNNAEIVDGSYAAFIADGTSLSLQKGEVDPAEYAKTWNVDCREFEDPADEASLRLDDPLKICGPNTWPPAYEEWALQAGFRAVTEPLDPWRGEAIMTAEGDLQLSFHHRLPGPRGADMRFAFTVDPDFSPVSCLANADGDVERKPLDGDWIKEWSTELEWLSKQDEEYLKPYSHLEPYLENGRLYFLNALSYQYNPADPTGADWDLPEIWAAGASQGKFSEENLFHRTARYAEPKVYNASESAQADETTYYLDINPDDLWFCDLATDVEPEEQAAAQAVYDQCMLDEQTNVRTIMSTVRTELELLTTLEKGGEPEFTWAPIGHTNMWRPTDGLPPGLDGWSELHFNYVVFSGDSDLTVGGKAEGAFSLTYDADESATRVFMKGRFIVDRIKEDRWTTSDLRKDKLIENDVELCSAASEDDAAPKK